MIDPVIQRNGFFAHPENILLAMLSDELKHIQELAVRRILKAREQQESQNIRDFSVPKLNFKALDYIDLIERHSSDIHVTAPPLVSGFTNDELKELPGMELHSRFLDICKLLQRYV